MTLIAIPGLEKTSDAFRRKLVALADRLQMDPGHIAAVMKFESEFSPQARNPLSRATGLIQWMPFTASSLYSMTVDQIYAMTAEQQLDLVEKYFARHGVGKLRRVQDVYYAVFCPNLIGRALDTVVGRAGDAGTSPCGASYAKVYEQNRGFDSAGRGYFTADDVARPVTRIFESAGGRTLAISSVASSALPLLVGTLVGGYVAWRSYRLLKRREVPV